MDADKSKNMIKIMSSKTRLNYQSKPSDKNNVANNTLKGNFFFFD